MSLVCYGMGIFGREIGDGNGFCGKWGGSDDDLVRVWAEFSGGRG